MKLSMDDKENSLPLVVKIKFFDLNQGEDAEEEGKKRLRVRFTKKRGDVMKWYEVFGQMKESFDDLLLAPKLHQNQEEDA
mmetsp:Transcript_5859/g.9452  ORF Transcript_5859/g.9452 Transcript_5859/m.9452 type:complete len:80 (-) Transcript_5859:72-311(-)